MLVQKLIQDLQLTTSSYQMKNKSELFFLLYKASGVRVKKKIALSAQRLMGLAAATSHHGLQTHKG
jgi:hypothetical protein